MGKLGEKCAKRVFLKLGGRTFEKDDRFDDADFAGILPGLGLVGVQAKTYGFQPKPLIGGLTGLDEKEIDKLIFAEHSGVPVLVFFPDYILKRVYWAPSTTLILGFDMEDSNRVVRRFPVVRMKYGKVLQLLWPPLWFHKVLGNWMPMTDLEAGAMRKLRKPSSKSGLLRLGHEDEEAAGYAQVVAEWEHRHSQSSFEFS